jgi:2-octaprenylphenol hydroxylase
MSAASVCCVAISGNGCEETLLMQTTTHALHQLFQTALPGLAMLRNAGMNLTNALPVVKNLLVRYAIGAF